MKIKEYIYKTTDYLAQKDKLNIDVYPYYFLGYYNSDLFKRKMRIYRTKDKIREVLIPFTEDAFANTNEIHIFLGHCFTRKEFFKNRKHFTKDLTQMICHEIGHINQEQNLGKYTYEEQLIFKLENFLIESSLDFNKHYQKFHDNYYIEIDADLYGSLRTKEIFKHLKNNSEDLEFIERDINTTKIRKYNYDFEKIFAEALKILRSNPYLARECYEDLFTLPLLYLKDDLTFESLENIMYLNKEIREDISKISEIIITSEQFLKELDFNNLSTEEIEYLRSSLENKRKEELERLEYNKKLNRFKYLNPMYIEALVDSSNYRIERYNKYLKKLTKEIDGKSKNI